MENFKEETQEELMDNAQDTNLEGVLKLPIGFSVDGVGVMQVDIADTGSEAEKIYTKKPKQGKVHTWMGQIIAVSVSNIAGNSIASNYLKQTDKNDIPELVKRIPLLDAGALLIQIQRECWEDVIPDQKINCTNCGARLSVEVELNKIEMPKNSTGKPMLDYVVKLKKPHKIKSNGVELLAEYEGMEFNRMKFRTATLGDALKHEGVSKDEVLFWRDLAFDTLLELYYEDEDGDITPVPTSFISRRGKALWSKDLNTKRLKEIRLGMQTTLPSAKAFYEEKCPECDENTPFFAQIGHFFQA